MSAAHSTDPNSNHAAMPSAQPCSISMSGRTVTSSSEYRPCVQPQQPKGTSLAYPHKVNAKYNVILVASNGLCVRCRRALSTHTASRHWHNPHNAISQQWCQCQCRVHVPCMKARASTADTHKTLSLPSSHQDLVQAQMTAWDPTPKPYTPVQRPRQYTAP